MSKRILLLVFSIFIYSASLTGCTDEQQAAQSPGEIILVASTPGDSLIKSILGIDEDRKVDFIRWRLNLDPGSSEYLLNIEYGQSQPNTTGFSDGETEILEGHCSLSRMFFEGITREIYQLQINRSSSELFILKMDDNVFQILTPENDFLIGNGGWSYTLNRETPVPANTEQWYSLTDSPFLSNSDTVAVFQGRTPCMDLARDNRLDVDEGCFKLKWLLNLYRDSKTKRPTTYSMRGVIDNQPQDITGTWKIEDTPTTSIFILDPDKPEKSIRLLAGDKNVLFFINKDGLLYTGNKDHSYTLNRKTQNTEGLAQGSE